QWDTIGTGLNGGLLNIDIAPDGTVYCLSGLVTGGFPVNKLVNNNWVQLGNSGVYGYPWEVAVDENGVPHIGHAGAVQRYDGANWYMMANGPFNTFGSSYGGGIAFNKKKYALCSSPDPN